MYYPIGWNKVLKLDTNQDQGKILSVQANHEKELYFILTSKSIHIWCPRPAAEIVCHRRSHESIDKIGLNRLAVWKTDSSVIVVATERDQLLFYQIRRRITNTSASAFLLPSSPNDDYIYHLKHDSRNTKKLLNGQLPPDPMEQAHVPALTMFSFGKLDLSTVGVACLMSAQEELIVGSRSGQIYGIHWDGTVDDKFPWSLSSDVRKRSDFPADIRFSSVLSGFAIVFKSGRVGFIPSKLESDDLQNGDTNTVTCDTSISYLASVDNAVCTEINHRHRLVAFGLSDSRVIVCNIGDSNTSLVLNHTLEMNNQKMTNNNNLKLGKVASIQYSPDNFAIAVSWEAGEFALWSVFGSLLFCSNQWYLDSGLEAPMKPVKVSSLAWGREGYSLWLCVGKDQTQMDSSQELTRQSSFATNGSATMDNDRSESGSVSSETGVLEEVLVMSLARCNLATSPHQTCSSDSLLLIADEKIYVGPSVPHEDKFDHWICVEVPQSYLDTQYPIRYCTVNRDCKNLAVAGNRGLALYSIESRKWTHFSKKSHGECFSVCGDLIWWNDYLVASCFNFTGESFELRAYKTNESLDNSQVIVQQIAMEIIRMSIFENRLLVLYSDGTLSMFMLSLRRRPMLKRPQPSLTRSNSTIGAIEPASRDEQQSAGGTRRSMRSDSITSWSHPLKNSTLFDKDLVLQISPIENLIISNLQANPFCISSIALTRLHFKNHRTDDSILLNACGKLFLLEREMPPDPSNSSPSSDLSSFDLRESSLDSRRSSKSEFRVNSTKLQSNSIHLASASLKSAFNESDGLAKVTFKAVSVIATSVEQFWISPEISMASEMSYFKKSLWLSCGGTSNRLQIWLPLLNDHNDPPADLYVPDRIMLPIRCDIYPLAIRSSSAEHLEPDDAIVLGAESDVLYRDCKLFSQFPYATVKRQCRVYLHRILRELLLSQHLGYYAKKIAESCQSLPYFAHCFELLLHEVLEEEATSPVPLPDPMLPQVVKFIKQFPVFLETVVHCARKSELSMWSHLFDERAVGNPRRLFQECIEQRKYDTAASCLIILQSLDKNVVTSRMVRELIRLVKEDVKFNYLVEELKNFLVRAELENLSLGGSPVSPSS